MQANRIRILIKLSKQFELGGRRHTGVYSVKECSGVDNSDGGIRRVAMLQVDTSKDKVQGQRWDFCWQRNTLQVLEHKFWHQNIVLHCIALRYVFV